jgi:hypothetical protein
VRFGGAFVACLAATLRVVKKHDRPQLVRIFLGAGMTHLQWNQTVHEARGGSEVLAFNAFPRAHWCKIWSTNPLERLNKEIKRRTRVVGIFLPGCLRIGSPEVTRNLSVGPHGLDPVRASPFGLSVHRWSGDLRAAC